MHITSVVIQTATSSVHCRTTYVGASNMKHIWLLRWSDRSFCTILTKYEVRKHIFVEDPNTKFHENPSSGRRADTCGQTAAGGRTDKHNEASRRLAQMTRRRLSILIITDNSVSPFYRTQYRTYLSLHAKRRYCCPIWTKYGALDIFSQNSPISNLTKIRSAWERRWYTRTDRQTDRQTDRRTDTTKVT